MRILLIGGIIAVALCANAKAAISFTVGHYYSTNDSSRAITEYNASGTVIGSLSIPAASADELRGITFGPDGLLYVTAVRGGGFAVLAINSSGSIQQTYQGSVFLGGVISLGKLAVDSQHIYMAGNKLIRFDVGNPSSGVQIYPSNDVVDVEILPNGNLFAPSTFRVDEITSAGVFVRRIDLHGGHSFSGLKGIEYDPATNNLFATEFGSGDFFHELMRIDGTTGQLEANVMFTYSDDLFVTDTGNLLVGSRTDAPRIYDQNLNQIGTLGTVPQLFVTEFTPLPEVNTSLAIGILGSSLMARRRASR